MQKVDPRNSAASVLIQGFLKQFSEFVNVRLVLYAQI
jgi:hypothetical protein